MFQNHTDRVPVSTYRLQFGPHLSCADATRLCDYLETMGAGAVYASPLFRAREGSSHGYDVVDHNAIDPQIGNETDFRALAECLGSKGMGLILDLVPNHMGIDDPHNVWWQDVLANGRSSPYAQFFDIEWNSPKKELEGVVLVPALGDQYGKVLEEQQLHLTFHDGFVLEYFSQRFPIAMRTWPMILARALAGQLGHLAPDDPARIELESIVTSLRRLPDKNEQDPAIIEEGRREQQVARRRLMALVRESPAVEEAIEATARLINGKRGEPRSFDLLEGLLAEQAYRLSHWRVAADEINYRRFFDVNSLAAIHVEIPQVFQAVHALTFRFLRSGWVTGLRVDHPDGLLDPEQYFAWLQEGFRATFVERGEPVPPGPRPLYVVAEKILGSEERLRGSWTVAGTTGYDFLNWLNGIYVDRHSALAMKKCYSEFTGIEPRFSTLYYESKKTILDVVMSSELRMLAQRLDRISEQHRWSRDFTLATLEKMLAEVIARFPVYRSYVRSGADGVSEEDERLIHTALRLARRHNPAVSQSVFDFLASVLLCRHPEGLTPDDIAERREFVLRFQQLTGPVTAKGLEDTAFYRVYPLVSLNDVGGEPAEFGMSLEEFHRRTAERAETWPYSMSASTTHDTKRSEDVRARINVLSELPDEWSQTVNRWHALNRHYTRMVEGAEVPDANEEYLFYQTLIGTWPLTPFDRASRDEYIGRLVTYMLKATKEAKLNTSWINPNAEHDTALEQFVRGALAEENLAFEESVAAFQDRIICPGLINSLAQLVVKIAAPGVPDFYQGTELWTFTLVDPDNRRPIDFLTAQKQLDSLRRHFADDPASVLRDVRKQWKDGRIKLLTTWRSLICRRSQPNLFLRGKYLPLTVSGELSSHVCAFARVHHEQWAIAIAPRLIAHLPRKEAMMLEPRLWRDTFVELPETAPQNWQNAITTVRLAMHEHRIVLSEAFADLPVAILLNVR